MDNIPATPILPWLYLGTRENANDLQMLKELGIKYILNVTQMDQSGVPNYFQERSEFVYFNKHMLDSDLQKITGDSLEGCMRFLEQARHAGDGSVLVHCKHAKSRSPTVVMAYLIRHQSMTFAQAFQLVTSKRTGVEPAQGFIDQLQEISAECHGGACPPHTATEPNERRDFEPVTPLSQAIAAGNQVHNMYS
eukprot:GILJ01015974.1.p1 GENE.GILJ01015974.1~~GILJ01015974.1.p1  ORF type:complete len:193 (+),score=15.17 GILJ01015974.1:11-589(+)